jgi:hypothetical protein
VDFTDEHIDILLDAETEEPVIAAQTSEMKKWILKNPSERPRLICLGETNEYMFVDEYLLDYA